MRTTTIKFIIIGDANTGKTTLANSFVNDASFLSPEPTIGLDFFVKQVHDQRYGDIKFTLWDTSGAERHNMVAMTQTYYRGAEGVILVFDLTDRKSFNNISERWLPRLRSSLVVINENCKCILVGNKCDLVDHREVTDEEATLVASQNKMNYIELSSLKSDCMLVRQPFLILAHQLIQEGICKPVHESSFAPHRNGEIKLKVNTGVEEREQCCS